MEDWSKIISSLAAGLILVSASVSIDTDEATEYLKTLSRQVTQFIRG